VPFGVNQQGETDQSQAVLASIVNPEPKNKRHRRFSHENTRWNASRFALSFVDTGFTPEELLNHFFDEDKNCREVYAAMYSEDPHKVFVALRFTKKLDISTSRKFQYRDKIPAIQTGKSWTSTKLTIMSLDRFLHKQRS
jgi:hypothetical protein